LPILALFVCLLPELGDVVKNRVRANHFESDIDVEKSTFLFDDHPSVKTWPDRDVVSVEGMSFSRIERFRTDLFKLETSHLGVEEDLQEVHVVAIGRLHELNPLDQDLVLGSIMLSLVWWKISNLSETEQVESPINEELKLLLDLVLDFLENNLSEFTRVLWDLWLKLHGVLVDTLDLLLVECHLEEV